MRGAVGRGRKPECPAEARGERPDAPQADVQTDVGYPAIGAPEQGGRPLHPAGQEVLVRRLAEYPAELAAEVGAGKVRRVREPLHVELLAVAGVDQVFRA
jgi:hypothetical protein